MNNHNLELGDRVKVLYGKYKNRIAIITDFHMKEVGIEFEDDGDRVSVRYGDIEKL